MSTFGLQAELSRLEARNRELHGYLSELGSGVSRAYSELATFTNNSQSALAQSTNKIVTSHENVIRAYELQMEIDKMYLRFKQMELANKKIRECNNKKYYDFANYTTVRKIVQGLLDNLNLNMISDTIIYKSIEKKHLQTPQYWLTSSLLAIMGWKNDDKEMADRAVEISMNLDKKNTSIFFMLFNLRMGREDAALKWFNVYQECELKGSDQDTFLMLFSMLSRTINDTVDDKFKYEIVDFINRVIQMSVQAEGYSEQEIIDTVEHYLTRMKGDDKLQTTMLKRCLKDYSDMADIVVSAQNNINILQFVLDVANVPEFERNSYVDQFIQDEIDKPNDVERSVYDDIEYNELVISCGGDVDLAKQTFAARQERRKKDLNLIAEMVDWIYARGNDGTVNSQVKKNMFTLTKEIQSKSVGQYVDHYRQRHKDVHPAELGGYATEINFNDRQGERSKIQSFFEAERDVALAQIKNSYVIMGVVIAAAGIGLTIWSQVFAWLILLGVGAFLAVGNILNNNKQKKHLYETCQLNIQNKNDMMDALFGEYQIYLQELSQADAYVDRVLMETDRQF